MTDTVLPGRAASRPSSVIALLRHGRYVVAENPVTGVAFALFVLIALAALLGPDIVPYDPLASDTAVALKPPSLKHWFGTDQLGRDIFSRVIVATRLEFIVALSSVALLFAAGGIAGAAAGGQRGNAHSARARPAQHHAHHDGADFADHGLRHPQCCRAVVHRPW